MANRKLVLTVIGSIIFVAALTVYVRFSRSVEDEKKENQQTMNQTQGIQETDEETENEEINASGDKLENVTPGSEEYRGFILDNVLHSPSE